MLNIGPQHPSTHGVLRLITVLQHELVKWTEVEIGLLHRGTEKLCEFTHVNASIPYFSRMDYMSIVLQELVIVHAVENILNSYISTYTSIIRTLIGEIYRTLNHSLNITTTAIDIGLFTCMLYMFDEREVLINLIESVTGTRFHTAFLLPNRLRYDLPYTFVSSLFYFLIYHVRHIKELYVLLLQNRLFISRLKEIGIIPADLIYTLGLSGPIARASGVLTDCRSTNYDSYGNLD